MTDTKRTASEQAAEDAQARGAVFNRDNLPSDPGTWPEYRKTTTTRITPVEGPFIVETREGPLMVEQGFLAIDSQGFPYPIDAQEFFHTFEPAKPDTQLDFDRGVLRDLLPDLRHKIAIGKAHKIMAECGVDLGANPQTGQTINAEVIQGQIKASTKALERFEQLAEAGEGIPFSKLEVVTGEMPSASPKGPGGTPAA